MDELTDRCLKTLLQREGLTPKEGDLERFGTLIEQYLASLKALHSVDLGEEEIAPIFHPEWKAK